MSDTERDEMFSYYEARADSYEEFYEGRAQAIGALAPAYPVDAAAISQLLAGFGHGRVLDLACGTGFWLSAYGGNCTSVTLVDQAAAPLAKCRERVDALGLQAKARLVKGDLFDVSLDTDAYDACLLGFLLSHLSDARMTDLFRRLRATLRKDAALAVVDSAWSEARKPYRTRDGFERRALADGRSFSIRKKYFDREELEDLLAREGFGVQSAYAGDVFIGMTARRTLGSD